MWSVSAIAIRDDGEPVCGDDAPLQIEAFHRRGIDDELVGPAVGPSLHEAGEPPVELGRPGEKIGVGKGVPEIADPFGGGGPAQAGANPRCGEWPGRCVDNRNVVLLDDLLGKRDCVFTPARRRFPKNGVQQGPEYPENLEFDHGRPEAARVADRRPIDPDPLGNFCKPALVGRVSSLCDVLLRDGDDMDLVAHLVEVLGELEGPVDAGASHGGKVVRDEQDFFHLPQR